MTKQDPKAITEERRKKIHEKIENLEKVESLLQEAEDGLKQGQGQVNDAQVDLGKEAFGLAAKRLENAVDVLEKAHQAAMEARDMEKKSREARQKEAKARELMTMIEEARSQTEKLLWDARDKRDGLDEYKDLIAEAEGQGNWDLVVLYYQEALQISPNNPAFEKGLNNALVNRAAQQKEEKAVPRWSPGLVVRGVALAVLVAIGIGWAWLRSFQGAFVPPDHTPSPTVTSRVSPGGISIAPTFTPLPSPTVNQVTPTPTIIPSPRPTQPIPKRIPLCGRLKTDTYPYEQPDRDSRQYNPIWEGDVFKIVDVVERNDDSWAVIPWPGGITWSGEEGGHAFVPSKFVQVLSTQECAELFRQ